MRRKKVDKQSLVDRLLQTLDKLDADRLNKIASLLKIANEARKLMPTILAVGKAIIKGIPVLIDFIKRLL